MTFFAGEEEWVKELRQTLAEAAEKAMLPLHDYLKV